LRWSAAELPVRVDAVVSGSFVLCLAVLTATFITVYMDVNFNC